MSAELELIRRCLEGDAQAWDELFTQHYAPTGRFLFQLSPDLSPEDVEEICQEVFISVVKNLASFNARSHLQTWIFRIAVNKARDYLDKQRAAKRGGGVAPVSLQAEDPETGLKLDLPGNGPHPDQALMRQENAQLIVHALAQLGDPCREIIELRYFGDLSYEDIAADLNLNTKTVSSRLSKCLDKLGEIARKIFSGKELSSPSV